MAGYALNSADMGAMADKIDSIHDKVMDDAMAAGGGGRIVELSYPSIGNEIPIEDDPTAFVDEEDFDFGLFISNIINDHPCRDRIYQGDQG